MNTNPHIQDKLDQFFAAYKKHTFKKGQYLISLGEKNHHVYYVTKGYVKQVSPSVKGEEICLNIFNTYTFFPMTIPFAEATNSHAFVAMTDVTAWEAPVQKTFEFVKDNPDVLLDLTTRLFIGVNGLLTRLEHLLGGTSVTRMANVIYTLTLRFGKPHHTQMVVNLPITINELANLSGITRETASRNMKIFRTKKILTFAKKVITVLDMDQLLEMTKQV